jgi:hypothetical protein
LSLLLAISSSFHETMWISFFSLQTTPPGRLTLRTSHYPLTHQPSPFDPYRPTAECPFRSWIFTITLPWLEGVRVKGVLGVGLWVGFWNRLKPLKIGGGLFVWFVLLCDGWKGVIFKCKCVKFLSLLYQLMWKYFHSDFNSKMIMFYSPHRASFGMAPASPFEVSAGCGDLHTSVSFYLSSICLLCLDSFRLNSFFKTINMNTKTVVYTLHSFKNSNLIFTPMSDIPTRHL